MKYLKVLCSALATILALQAFGAGQAQARSEIFKHTRSIVRYELPDVALINQDGKKVRLRTLVESGKPVIVDFIFGTCTTICPILSACYVNLQNRLGAETDKVHLVSISIDPENDTPKVMKEYLKRYRAKPGWDFLTGSRRDIDAVMRALDAYIPNKMSHFALTLIYVPQQESWVRINGILSNAEFMAETRKAGIQ